MPSQLMILLLGLSSRRPQPGLAPESALRLLPGRALSATPAVCSVSARASFDNGGMKKRLTIAALSDMSLNGPFWQNGVPDRTALACRLGFEVYGVLDCFRIADSPRRKQV